MARRRRKNSSSGERDTSVIANAGVARQSHLSPVQFESSLQEIEDRRTFHPVGPYRPIRRVSTAAPATVTLRDRKYKKAAAVVGRSWRSPLFRGANVLSALRSQTKASLALSNPERVVACVRRQRRKEVLFAERKAGRSGRALRRRRRNETSNYRC